MYKRQTYERIDMIPLMVVKKDQTREAFQADKLRHGIIKALSLIHI